MHEIRIGGETVDRLTLTIHGRQFPDSADYWDGNWLTCDVDVAVGAFQGAFGAVIRNEDFSRFLRELRPLYEQLVGRATLEALTGWLCLDFVGDGRGQIRVEGHLSDNCNTLNLRLDLDQSDLKPLIGRLEEIRLAYPVVG